MLIQRNEQTEESFKHEQTDLSIESTLTWIGFTVLCLQHTVSTHHIHRVGSHCSGDNVVNATWSHGYLVSLRQRVRLYEKHGVSSYLEFVWAESYMTTCDERRTSRASLDLVCNPSFCLSSAQFPSSFLQIMTGSSYFETDTLPFKQTV